jgi:hypothetical protein
MKTSWKLAAALTMTAASGLWLAPAAYAVSSNPPSPPFEETCTQGGSNNTCPNENSGANGGVTNKHNPAGNNQTCTTTVDNKCQ